MTLVPLRKKDNFSAAYNTRREVDNLLDNLFSTSWLTPFAQSGARDRLTSLSPLSDIAETKLGYNVSMELPGLKESDIDVSLNGDILTIKGEKKQEETKEERNYHYSERVYGSFERSIKLPDNATIDSISATFNDGVLNVFIPKKAPTPSSVKKITVSKKSK